MAHRNTPHPTTGVEPSVAMLGQRARSAIGLVHPLNSSKRRDKLIDHEQTVINSESETRQFEVGEKVLFYDEHHKEWKSGVVTQQLGSKIFETQSELGGVRKHLDQVVKNTIKGASTDKEPEQSGRDVVGKNGVSPVVEHGTEAAIPTKANPESQSASSSKDLPDNRAPVPTREANLESSMPPSIVSRTSLRSTRPPDRLSYSKLVN